MMHRIGRGPYAHSFQLCECDDPMCGPHIIALDEGGDEMCHIIISQEAARGLISELQNLLYKKVANDD